MTRRRLRVTMRRVGQNASVSEKQKRLLSIRFSAALASVAELHARQRRKKPRDVAYISHLLGVASAVLDDGGSEDEAIAGLFHDSIEDQGMTVERLTEDWGAEVARVVSACTDSVARPGEPKLPWLGRKKTHLDHLRALGADTAVLRVTAADKLHNCNDIVWDLKEDGVGLERLDAFQGGREGTCWYYGQMADVVGRGLPASRLSQALQISVRELHDLAGMAYPAPEPLAA